jgi:hypothetical protein
MSNFVILDRPPAGWFVLDVCDGKRASVIGSHW